MEFNYIVTEGNALTAVQDICAHPKPDVKWKIEDDNFTYSSSSFLINNITRKYGYIFTTRPLDRRNCGKRIIFKLINHQLKVERFAKIDVKFKPSAVPRVSSFMHNGSCILVTWAREITGNCVIIYHLQFGHKKAVYNTANTYFVFCISSHVDSVTIWASYKQSIGENISIRIFYMPTPPTSPHSVADQSSIQATFSKISSTIMKRSEVKIDEHQCKYQVIVAVVVAIAITMILITLFIVMLQKKGFVIVNINCGQRPQRVEGANIDDYETVGPTSSPYADLQAAKPSIYADLTTTTNQCKQYAEIELKDIH